MRSVFELLARPLFGSQQAMLTAQSFARAAEERDVRLSLDELEVLHREGMLVPFLGIRYDVKAIRKRDPSIGGGHLRAVLDYTATEGQQLTAEHAAGDLIDPTQEAFTPYSRLRGTFGGRSYDKVRYLYSPYQLLRLRTIKPLLPNMRWHKRTGPSLALLPLQRELGVRTETTYRPTLIALHAVEPIFRPAVVESVRGTLLPGAVDAFQAWDTLRAQFDPTELLSWIGWTADSLRAVAERLLVDARWADPLREWEDLVAQVRPERWARLRGDALTSVDHKIAAEMLLRFHDELVRPGAAQPLEPSSRFRSPLDSRLTRDRASLNEVLTVYDLSPHASVLLVVEGATEFELMPRVFDLVSRNWRGYVDILDAGGATRALDPLMAYVASPRVSREQDRGLLVRPPVRILVVMDPEGDYVTEADRDARREQWLARILRTLPAGYQTQRVQAQLTNLVDVMTWNRAADSFEFAHWSDRQIARAILSIAPNAPMSLPSLMASVHGVRRRRGNLESLWHAGWPGRKPRKPDIANALWPSLMVRAESDLGRQHPRLPAIRCVRRALGMTRLSPRYMMHVITP
jgi:hypothetical protein